MDDIYVVGVGMTPLGRLKDRTLRTMAAQAVTAALTDAGCWQTDIGAAFFSSSTTGILQGQTFIAGQISLREMGFESIPIYNLENASASGTSAFNLAVQSIRAGACNSALAVGAEKMNIEDRGKMFSVFDGGWDIEAIETTKAALLALGEGVPIPDGGMSDQPYSVFMDVYAAFCRFHMKTFGTTQRQIAAVSAKNHRHSVHNPNAQFREAYSIEQVLAARPVCYPLTLPMCAPISDGADRI